MTTFMFWNLHEAAWSLRKGDERQWLRQVEIVRNHRPDVLAITEGWDWHLDDRALFTRALQDFDFPHGVLYEAKTSCDQAVMWRDPIELISSQEQAQAVAPWHGWLRATLRLPERPDPFVLQVSHLNPFDPTLRRIEGSFLRNLMQHTEAGMLVMDANSIAPGDPVPVIDLARNFPGDPADDRVPLEGLAQSGLVDVGASRGDRTPTFGFFGGRTPSETSQIRIDQAWVTPGIEVDVYKVLDDADVDPGIDEASDHRPLWIEIS